LSGEVLRLRKPSTESPELSDEAVARACAAGDAGAIATLFDRFHRPVVRYLTRLIGGGADVDDLLQSTFLEVARGVATYDDGRGAVLSWLFGIATNVVRHHRRSSARRVRLLAAAAWVGPRSGAGAADVVEARAELGRADAALRALPDDLREAFVLCELESLSAREAARIVGASEVAVWKRVSKARAEIRRAVLGGDR